MPNLFEENQSVTLIPRLRAEARWRGLSAGKDRQQATRNPGPGWVLIDMEDGTSGHVKEPYIVVRSRSGVTTYSVDILEGGLDLQTETSIKEYYSDLIDLAAKHGDEELKAKLETKSTQHLDEIRKYKTNKNTIIAKVSAEADGNPLTDRRRGWCEISVKARMKYVGLVDKEQLLQTENIMPGNAIYSDAVEINKREKQEIIEIMQALPSLVRADLSEWRKSELDPLINGLSERLANVDEQLITISVGIEEIKREIRTFSTILSSNLKLVTDGLNGLQSQISLQPYRDAAREIHAQHSALYGALLNSGDTLFRNEYVQYAFRGLISISSSEDIFTSLIRLNTEFQNEVIPMISDWLEKESEEGGMRPFMEKVNKEIDFLTTHVVMGLNLATLCLINLREKTAILPTALNSMQVINDTFSQNVQTVLEIIPQAYHILEAACDSPNTWLQLVQVASLDGLGGRSIQKNQGVAHIDNPGRSAQDWQLEKSQQNPSAYKLVHPGSNMLLSGDANAEKISLAPRGASHQDWQFFRFQVPQLIEGPSHGSSLKVGQHLEPGERLLSKSKLYELVFKINGDLILQDSNKNIFWQHIFNGSAPGKLILRENGELTIYDTDNQLIWALPKHRDFRTGERDPIMHLQGDRHLVIYQGGNGEHSGRHVWSSSTNIQFVNGASYPEEGESIKLMHSYSGKMLGGIARSLTSDRKLEENPDGQPEKLAPEDIGGQTYNYCWKPTLRAEISGQYTFFGTSPPLIIEEMPLQPPRETESAFDSVEQETSSSKVLLH